MVKGLQGDPCLVHGARRIILLGAQEQEVAAHLVLVKRGGIDVHDDAELSASIAGKDETGDAQRLLKARADRAEHLAAKERLSLDAERGKLLSVEDLKREASALGQFQKETILP